MQLIDNGVLSSGSITDFILQARLGYPTVFTNPIRYLHWRVAKQYSLYSQLMFATVAAYQ
ncbi:hypothetical protein OH492_13710 [Vibrio chagasii]|nr:hypothetical protein [Vibrio chagasii]